MVLSVSLISVHETRTLSKPVHERGEDNGLKYHLLETLKVMHDHYRMIRTFSYYDLDHIFRIRRRERRRKTIRVGLPPCLFS